MIPTLVYRESYYLTQYNAMTLNPGIDSQASLIVDRLNQNQAIYTQIANAFKIPFWQVIGVLHQMECELDLSKHLANGDPLDHDTVRVPKGIMAPLAPPYTFQEGAIAALDTYKEGWNRIEITGLASAFTFLNRWNGLGEWRMTDTPGLPYLFAGTSAYKSGKFASDGTWDPALVSKQIGAAVFFKILKVFG